MAMNINEIRQFFKIGGVFRAPEATEDGKKLTYNYTDDVFDYTDDNALESVVRETGTDRAEFTLKDGTKTYLSLGALAWLNSVTSAVTSVFGRTGDVVAESGDYSADQITNAFDKANDTLDDIEDGTAYKRLSAGKLGEINANTAARHTHTNKAVLDLITAAGGGIIPTALQIATWDAYTTATEDFIEDVVAALIQNGIGISWTYDDTNATLTPTIDLSAFTTDNLPEGVINKYMSDLTQVIRTVYTITLPASSDVSTRIAGAVETTDYPTDWVLAVAANPNDLEITHNLTQKIAYVSVFYVDGTEQILLMGNLGYTGVSAPSEDVLVIKGLSTKAFPLVVQLIFS